MRQLTLRVSLSGLIVGLLCLFVAAPASATGGGTVWVKDDRVWRTQTFVVRDHTIPESCPGPTSQALAITARFKGGPQGFWIKNIRIKNKTRVNLIREVHWNWRLKYMQRRATGWRKGVTKTMHNPPWVNDGKKVASYQDWGGKSNARGLHTLGFGSTTGEVDQCHGFYQILVKRW